MGAVAWELQGRGGREWRHIEERRRVRERDSMMKNKTERHGKGERKGDMRKIKHEERFRKGNEPV